MATPQETVSVAVRGMVYASAVSMFAQAMGVLTAGAELGYPILGQLPKEKGIQDLKEMFGPDVVSKALSVLAKKKKATGKEYDIIDLARAVESQAYAALVVKYGDAPVDTALQNCPAGDFGCVKSVAAALAGERITPSSPPAKVEEAVSKGKARGKRVAQPVKDTKTGTVYQSKASAGMAVAAEYGLDPKNHFVWYDVIKKDPGRFVRV